MDLGPQFDLLYEKVDVGARRPVHKVAAVRDGQPLGSMVWSSRAIQNIEVEPEHQRQGIGRALWNEGHRLAQDNARIPAPKHSTDRTDQGDAWAKAVGGRVPRRLDLPGH
jgi:GNAT superfamily N-acetyltransferase